MLRVFSIRILVASVAGIVLPLYAEQTATEAGTQPASTSPSATNEKAKPPLSVFDSLTPPKSEGEYLDTSDGHEDFAWDCDNHQWLSLLKLDLGIRFMRLSETTGTVIYLNAFGKGKTIYRWKGVVLSTETRLFPNNELERTLDARRLNNVNIVDVDPPVQFYKDPKGNFRPCYYTYGAALVWKNVIVPEAQVPKESVQHRWPILEQGNPERFKFTVYEINIPEHLVPLVKEWIVKPDDKKQ